VHWVSGAAGLVLQAECKRIVVEIDIPRDGRRSSASVPNRRRWYMSDLSDLFQVHGRCRSSDLLTCCNEPAQTQQLAELGVGTPRPVAVEDGLDAGSAMTNGERRTRAVKAAMRSVPGPASSRHGDP
jgi:hypothetical protein